MSRETLWSNSDGLYVGFGTHTADGHVAGQVGTDSTVREVQIEIIGKELADVAVPTAVKNGGVRFPAGTLLVDAKLTVYEAFAGTNAVLDIGTFGTDDWAAINDDGIDAAIAVATLVDNYQVACDGADVAAVVAEEFVIAGSYDTAAFTAGRAVLTVRYLPPRP